MPFFLNKKNVQGGVLEKISSGGALSSKFHLNDRGENFYCYLNGTLNSKRHLKEFFLYNPSLKIVSIYEKWYQKIAIRS